MKFKKLLLFSLLLFIVTVGAVSASDNILNDDSLISNADNQDIIHTEDDDGDTDFDDDEESDDDGDDEDEDEDEESDDDEDEDEDEDEESDDDEDSDFDYVPTVNVPESMNAGENKYITFEANPGIFTIDIDDNEYEIEITTGKAAFSLAFLDDATYDIFIEYNGDDASYWFESYEINVKSVPAKLTGGKNIVMNYGSTVYYKLTVYGTNGRLAEENDCVDLLIDKSYDEMYTNKYGVATFRIPTSLAPGKHTIKATYLGVTVTHTITIKSIVSLKTVKVKKSAKKLVLSATFKNIKNKKVTFKFNGKTYSAKTSSKGLAKVTIKSNVLKKLKVGKKITYQAAYLKDVVKKTVKVAK